MEAVNVENITKDQSLISDKRKKASLYQSVWRWHFYAGIFFAPLIIFLSITGGIYLFKPQIESYMYHNLYYVQQGQQKIAPTEQINDVKMNYPNAEITSFRPSYEANRSSEVGINDNGESVTVFVNPYNGKIIGKLNDNDRFMASARALHSGELWGGTLGKRLVELCACWAIILVITGVYLWWPRNRKSLFGTLIPRLRMSKGKRMFWKDLHAVTAIWLSLFILIQLFSGLMWTDIWGGAANRVVTATGSGSPVGIYPWESYAFPKSTIQSKNVANVPWAAENLPVPKSGEKGVTPISVEKVIQIVKNNNVHAGYNIAFPEGKTGVYTVYLNPAEVYPTLMPWAQQTLHIDQYSGEVLANLGWKDYGTLGKLITMSIAFHEGDFGLLNQIFMLGLVIGIIMIVVSGVVMWWKRRPKGKLGSPALPKNFKMLKGVALIVLILGIFFPLAGLSLLVVWALDYLVIKRIPKLKQWIG